MDNRFYWVSKFNAKKHFGVLVEFCGGLGFRGYEVRVGGGGVEAS